MYGLDYEFYHAEISEFHNTTILGIKGHQDCIRVTWIFCVSKYA